MGGGAAAGGDQVGEVTSQSDNLIMGGVVEQGVLVAGGRPRDVDRRIRAPLSERSIETKLEIRRTGQLGQNRLVGTVAVVGGRRGEDRQ